MDPPTNGQSEIGGDGLYTVATDAKGKARMGRAEKRRHPHKLLIMTENATTGDKS